MSRVPNPPIFGLQGSAGSGPLSSAEAAAVSRAASPHPRERSGTLLDCRCPVPRQGGGAGRSSDGRR